MSKQRALEVIAGRFADRIPQWDFPDSPLLARKLFGYDIWQDTRRTAADLWRHFDIDLAHYLPGGIAEWNFPLVRYYGEADYIEDESAADYRRAYCRPLPEAITYRSMYDALKRKSAASSWGLAPTMNMKDYGFPSPEDVLAFNPLDHDRATFDERKSFFKRYYAEMQSLLGDDCLMMGWYYHTLFMWPVEIFGWENFMIAAMTDQERFNEILLQFLDITKRDIRAMCEVEGLPLIACHDDLSSARGPMFDPAWYERYIFPHYHEIFSIIHSAGKKALFVSDGNVEALLPRLAAAGADGIAIDTNTSLQAAVESFSGKIICGGMDPAVISQGSLGDIEAMVRKTVVAVKDQPGYFFQCPGMTGRAPIQNIERYQELIREYGKR